MLEPLTYDFMQRSRFAAALVGSVCSVIGVFVVLRGLAFCRRRDGARRLCRVTLAYLLGLPPEPRDRLRTGHGLITGWVEEKAA